MGKKYTREQWDQAYDLVVHEGYTYADASEATGISMSSIQKRGREQDWVEDRKAASEGADEYRNLVFKLKLEAAREAAQSKDPQSIHALNALERMFPEHRYRKEKTDLSDRDKRELTLQVIEAIVGYLEQLAPSILHQLRDHLRPLTEHVFGQMGVTE